MKRIGRFVRYGIAFLFYPFFRPPWHDDETQQKQTLAAYRAEADDALHTLRTELTQAWRHR